MVRSRNKKLLMIGASVRNCATQEIIVDNVKKLTNEPLLYEYIESCARGKEISNTEGCGIAAVYGARKMGVDVEYLRLNRYISKKGKFTKQAELVDRILAAGGYLFLTPVYFGDRSSLLFDLFSLLRRKGVTLEGRVSGMISVGAKRNGGQETTNVYTLQDLLQFGCVCVGNGPPTSQFGGTAVGGNMGTMDNDYFGIMTSMGVGTKVAGTIRLLASKPSGKPKIAFWLLEDYRDRRLLKYLKGLLPQLPGKADWSILDLTKYEFHECIACNSCPNRPDEPFYRCVLKTDDMAKVQKKLLDCDGFIACGLTYRDDGAKNSSYQRFVERTRYLRRDNFRLTDRIFCPLSLGEPEADSLYHLKVLTSFIRHNTVAHKGISAFDLSGGLIEPDVHGILSPFVDYCARSRAWRRSSDGMETSYKAIGY